MNHESIVFRSGTDQEEYSGQMQEVRINGSNENQENNEVISEKLANDINDGKSQVVNNEIEYIDMNVHNDKDINDTSQQKAECERIMNTPQRVPAQTCIMGDVSLTPTHRTFTPQTSNPHNAMVAITPIATETSQAKNSIKLQNCVSSVSLGCELKLLDIYSRTRFSEYNPARFHGVVMKILDPRATALVFRSGKIVCTGARNEHDSYIAARKFARIIQKLGFPAKFLDFKIQNFIATADLRFPIRLESLQQAHGQFSSYEPELFPGLVYRMVRPRVVLLIFVNGKIVFTGKKTTYILKLHRFLPLEEETQCAIHNIKKLTDPLLDCPGGKTRNEISEALDIIYPILRSYRKN